MEEASSTCHTIPRCAVRNETNSNSYELVHISYDASVICVPPKVFDRPTYTSCVVIRCPTSQHIYTTQQQTQQTSTVQSTQRNYLSTNTQSQDLYKPHMQTQYKEQRPYIQQPDVGPSRSKLSPNLGLHEEYDLSYPTYM